MKVTLPAAFHDESEEHVNKVLGLGDEAAKLLRLRAEFQEMAATRALSDRAPTAVELNDVTNASSTKRPQSYPQRIT